MSTGPSPPTVGSKAERRAFALLQGGLPDLFRRAFPNDKAPRTVVIVPSLSLDQEVLAKIQGVHHYEERMLCLLLLLRMPRTNLIYITSNPIAPAIIDYYLHLLPGVPAQHARRRLTLLACHDSSAQALTAKILARPRMVERIRAAIADAAAAHMACFNVSPLERSLAVQLAVPIYGCDPDLLHLGSKSGSRRAFRTAGIGLPDGFEDLSQETELSEALATLKARDPKLRRAVVKLNEGFSGEGNAVFRFDDAPQGRGLKAWVRDRLPQLAFEACDMTWEPFRAKLAEMGGIAEAFVEGAEKRSPSVQLRIDPLGGLDLVSTHDQVLGGNSGQIFLGCRFPADPSYRQEIQAEGLKAAQVLRDQGVVGRLGVDFISVREGGRWRHYAIEINLRKGGTTHPFLTLQFLTGGHYDPESGAFRTADGRSRCYVASDNLEDPRFRSLTPDDLIDIAVMNDLHFNSATQEGVFFHLIGALSEFGKLGIVCVAKEQAGAERLYQQTATLLQREADDG